MTPCELDIVTRTLYGEARGEYTKFGPASLIAVTNVIVNRWKHNGRFGATLTDVCLKARQFSCWNRGNPNRILIQQMNLEQDPVFQTCQMVVKKVVQGAWPDLTRESDHYHATSCRPSWARVKKIRLRLGNHIFYHLS